MISQEIIGALRLAVSIELIVSEQVNLRRSGSQLVGMCVLCGPKSSSSFKVDPEKQLFHCFRCGVGGDVFVLVGKLYKLEFPEAVKFVAAKAGITVGGYISEDLRKRVADRERVRAAEKALDAFIDGRQAQMDFTFYQAGQIVSRVEEFLEPRLFDPAWRPSWFEAFKVELGWAAIQAYFEVGNCFFSRDRFVGRDVWLENEFEPEPLSSRSVLEHEFRMEAYAAG